MEDFRDVLFSKAFKIVPGTAYNRASHEMREAEAYALFYEVVLEEGQGWEHLRDKVFPSFARYLKMKSVDPESSKGVVASIFYKDKAYFIEGPDFFRVFREMEGLNASAFHFRVLKWLAE